MGGMETVGLRAVFEGGDRYISQLKSAERAERDVADSAEKAADGTRKFGDAADKTESKLGKVVKVAGILGGVMVAGVVAGVAKAGFEFNAMYQGAEIAFTQMLGSGEKARDFLDELASFAAKTPFEFPDLIQTARTLTAMGFEAEEIIPTMTAIGNAVSAMGGSPEILDRVTRALTQIKAKGKASAEEMLQLAESGIPAWQFLADHLGVTIPQAMDKVKKGSVDATTTIDAMLEGMNAKFGGMMEVQSRTFSGVISTLKDTFTQLSGRIMAPFFEMATTGLLKLADLTSSPAFMRAIDSFANTLAKGTSFAAKALIEIGKIVLPPVIDAFKALWDVGELVVGFLTELGQRVMPYAVEAFNVISSAVEKVVGFLTDLVDQAIPPVLDFVIDNGKAVVDFFKDLGEKYGPLVVAVFEDLWDAGGDAAAVLKTLGEKYLPVVRDRLKDVAKFGGDAVDMFADLATKAVDTVLKSEKLNEWLDDLKGLLAEVPGAIEDLGSRSADAGNKIAGIDWSGLFAPLADKMTSLTDYLGPKFIALFAEIIAQFDPLVQAIKSEVAPTLESFSGVVAAANEMMSRFAPIAQVAAEQLGPILSASVKIAVAAFGSLIDWGRVFVEVFGPVLVKVIENTGTIIRGFAGVLEGSLIAITGALDVFIAVFTGDWRRAWEGIKEILFGALQIIVSIFKTQFDLAVNTITGALELINRMTAGKLFELAGIVRDGIGEVLGFFEDLGSDVIDAVGDAISWLIDTGSDIVTGLWNGIESAWGWFNNLLGGIPEDVVKGIGDMARALLETGMDILKGIWNGVTLVKDWFVTKLDDVADWAVDGIGSLYEAMKEIGGDILRGIWQGILDTKDWFMDRLGDVGGWVEDGLKGALRISSPSKMTAELGESIPEGLAVGIEAGNPYVLDAIDASTGLIRDEYIDAIYGLTPALNEAGAAIPLAVADGMAATAPILVGAIGDMISSLRFEASKELKTAVDAFTTAIDISNRQKELTAAYGEVGGELASALAEALAEGTPRAGERLAKALEKALDEAKDAGVDDVMALGSELTIALANALSGGTPAAVTAVLQIISRLNDAINVAAEKPGEEMVEGFLRGVDNAVSAKDLVGKGKDVASDFIGALSSAIDKGDNKVIEDVGSMAGGIVNALTKGLDAGIAGSLASNFIGAVTNAIKSGSDSAIALVEDALKKLATASALAGGGVGAVGGVAGLAGTGLYTPLPGETIEDFNRRMGIGGGGTSGREPIGTISIAGKNVELFRNPISGLLETSNSHPFTAADAFTDSGERIVGGNLQNWGFKPLAEGTPFLPADMLALVHKGEAVIPAESNPFNPFARAFLPSTTNNTPAIFEFTADFRGATLTGTIDENTEMVKGVFEELIREQLGRDAFLDGNAVR